jgi:hypothetical protein
MSVRPKFWSNRSPRFWWGFWIFMFLFACWAWTCYFRLGIAHQSATGRSLEFTTARGCLILSSWRQESPAPGLIPNWEFQSSPLVAFDGAPRVSRIDTSMGVYHQLFIPLWIPCLAWLVLWPLWLRRAHKKAGANFSAPAEMENR